MPRALQTPRPRRRLPQRGRRGKLLPSKPFPSLARPPPGRGRRLQRSSCAGCLPYPVSSACSSRRERSRQGLCHARGSRWCTRGGLGRPAGAARSPRGAAGLQSRARGGKGPACPSGAAPGARCTAPATSFPGARPNPSSRASGCITAGGAGGEARQREMGLTAGSAGCLLRCGQACTEHPQTRGKTLLSLGFATGRGGLEHGASSGSRSFRGPEKGSERLEAWMGLLHEGRLKRLKPLLGRAGLFSGRASPPRAPAVCTWPVCPGLHRPAARRHLRAVSPAQD